MCRGYKYCRFLGDRGGLLLAASVWCRDNYAILFGTFFNIAFIDPNIGKTKSWMQGLGLQLSSDTNALGSINRIAHSDG